MSDFVPQFKLGDLYRFSFLAVAAYGCFQIAKQGLNLTLGKPAPAVDIPKELRALHEDEHSASPRKHHKLSIDSEKLELKRFANQQTEDESFQVFKICITGGPCSGKTSGLVYLAEKLRYHGFMVYVVVMTIIPK